MGFANCFEGNTLLGMAKAISDSCLPYMIRFTNRSSALNPAGFAPKPL
ncbi:hypothetical protein [Papillibacter cinnamivorans]|uniref:Uncharacterized protein n=1 Tax=Papillibacter cinnamivorans DSM 12816 TaxID=1122930 RepID=A0A1W2CBT6_9FIRM|nr:hypothetical protein [Papillibacter cinnamivorans]SMC82737.1 hypothetical protein SAMN02745168_2739 [Papillibacter cinnamivorans DSM 12816]